jgi:hypothetical protein
MAAPRAESNSLDRLSGDTPIAWLRDGDDIIPARVLIAGKLRSKVAVFRTFRGVKVKRVWNRRLIAEEVAQDYFDFKRAPTDYFTTLPNFIALDVPAFAAGEARVLAIPASERYYEQGIVVALTAREARRLHGLGRLKGWTPA